MENNNPIETINEFSLDEILEYKFEILIDQVNGSKTNNHNLYQIIQEIFEKILFRKVIEKVDNNQTKAAKILGINRNTLKKKLLKYNLIQKQK